MGNVNFCLFSFYIILFRQCEVGRNYVIQNANEKRNSMRAKAMVSVDHPHGTVNPVTNFRSNFFWILFYWFAQGREITGVI